jgi:D-glycero-alpha-D-manno-heptose-7-phosphate kinase
MIITKTPLRISFAGSMSDLPSFYEKRDGAVISTAIDKYIYITLNKKFDDQIRASYSITEFANSPDELKHELIRESMKLVGINKGIEITSISDIPSHGTGLGSSSTYTVGLLNALYSYQGILRSQHQLAEEASYIEINKCGKTIGKQDQFIAGYGGFKFIKFKSDGTVMVDPIICKKETLKKLQNNLLFFYTGVHRKDKEILDNTSNLIENNKQKQLHISKLVHLAYDMKHSIEHNDLETFGYLLNEGWETKKSVYKNISTRRINDWYSMAIQNGALGGKLCGAGGGGFLIFYAEKENHHKIINALSELRQLKINFEPQGSRIIYIEN